MTKLLRTIRFDESDINVFDIAAEPREWAISCAFQFCDRQWDEMDGKTRQAFNNGFLGLESFGYSTFGTVVSINNTQLNEVENTLTKYLLDSHGAPDRQTALDAAKEELIYMAELCREVQETTVFAVSREFSIAGGIKEAFHKVDIENNSYLQARVWVMEERD